MHKFVLSRFAHYNSPETADPRKKFIDSLYHGRKAQQKNTFSNEQIDVWMWWSSLIQHSTILSSTSEN